MLEKNTDKLKEYWAEGRNIKLRPVHKNTVKLKFYASIFYNTSFRLRIEYSSLLNIDLSYLKASQFWYFMQDVCKSVSG